MIWEDAWLLHASCSHTTTLSLTLLTQVTTLYEWLGGIETWLCVSEWVINFCQDMAFDYGYLSESFETSVPWNRYDDDTVPLYSHLSRPLTHYRVVDLCRNVKDRVVADCKRHGVTKHPLISCRVRQTYDAGACVYFYIALNYSTVGDLVPTLWRTLRCIYAVMVQSGV